MKITNITAIYPKYQNRLTAWRVHFWQIVVKIETDVGVTGYGYGGGGVAAVEVVNRHFRGLLLDRTLDSTAGITTIWDELYRASLPYGRRGIAIMALSGLDLALWDLLGQAEKMPVCRLISDQPRDRLRAYATGPDTVWYAERGFTAHKLPHRWTGDPAVYDQTEAWATESRALFGAEALLMLDCYMSWDSTVTLEMARRLKAYNIYWFEDVLTPDHLTEQADLRQPVKPILIAGGEHEFTHFGFQEIARTNALDLWQPDITWCGGITAGLRIVALAQQAGLPVVPHRGGEVWGLHLIAATACDNLAEVLPGSRNQQRDVLWQGEPEPIAGYLTLTDAPGFGVELNEALI
jgi:L-rhamnonate dehydratase